MRSSWIVSSLIYSASSMPCTSTHIHSYFILNAMMIEGEFALSCLITRVQLFLSLELT